MHLGVTMLTHSILADSDRGCRIDLMGGIHRLLNINKYLASVLNSHMIAHGSRVFTGSKL